MRIISKLLAIVIISAGAVAALVANGCGNRLPVVESSAAASKPAAISEKWADASGGETQSVGGVTVGINDFAVGKVKLESFTGEGVSEKEHLVLRVTLSTNDESKRFDYRTWSGPILGRPTLRDDIGNAYPMIQFEFGTKVIGHISSASVYAGSPVSDILVFARPVAAAKELRLELPAKAFGQSGTLRFRMECPPPK